jgi:hypothetical protein
MHCSILTNTNKPYIILRTFTLITIHKRNPIHIYLQEANIKELIHNSFRTQEKEIGAMYIEQT